MTEGFLQSPNPDCALCMSERRIAAASMKELGATNEEIANAIGLAATEIDQHFRECIPSENADPRAASDAELDSLLRHATELYYGATLQNNLVAASSSLSVRLRVLSEMAEREASREKRQELLLGSDPADPSTWSPEVGVFIRSYMDSILERSAATAEKEEEVNT
jgi:hypothetical protein